MHRTGRYPSVRALRTRSATRPSPCQHPPSTSRAVPCASTRCRTAMSPQPRGTPTFPATPRRARGRDLRSCTSTGSARKTNRCVSCSAMACKRRQRHAPATADGPYAAPTRDRVIPLAAGRSARNVPRAARSRPNAISLDRSPPRPIPQSGADRSLHRPVAIRPLPRELRTTSGGSSRVRTCTKAPEFPKKAAILAGYALRGAGKIAPFVPMSHHGPHRPEGTASGSRSLPLPPSSGRLGSSMLSP
jgi:hypothetical protein